MANIEVKMTVNNTDAVLSQLQDAVKTALEAVGVQAQGHATDNITANDSVDTGVLRSSITFEVEDDTVAIGTNVHYAPYIEFGTGIHAESGGGRQTPWAWQDMQGNWHRTSGMEPKPFLRPAIEDNLDEYQQIMAQVLSQIGK